MTKIQNFINSLQDRKCYHGEPLEPEALIVAQKYLYNMGLGSIPASYSEFLKHYNGLKYDGSYLFGATVDDDLDIIDKNEQMNKPQNCMLLGYNDFDLLCYNGGKKQYQIVDRSDFAVLETYDENECGSALSEIFKL
ncbi:MAG: hypothetical protein J6039_04750 [Alphaproteobacteria bacterium]|nr:hypothetical protein [Alphaproteobacteria bacterium]